MEIVQVKTEAELEAFLILAQEYVEWMLAEIGEQYPELDRQSFSSKHGYDDIRKKFTAEDVLFIAKDGEIVYGCVALGKLSKDICEMRTLFIRAEARGKGAGKKLAEASMAKAKMQGYQRMRLDTLAFMQSALGLYAGLGFYEIEAYINLPANLKQYIRFLEAAL